MDCQKLTWPFCSEISTKHGLLYTNLSRPGLGISSGQPEYFKIAVKMGTVWLFGPKKSPYSLRIKVLHVNKSGHSAVLFIGSGLHCLAKT